MCRPTSGGDSEYAGSGRRAQVPSGRCPEVHDVEPRFLRRVGQRPPRHPSAGSPRVAAGPPSTAGRTPICSGQPWPGERERPQFSGWHGPQYHGGLRQLSDTVAHVTVVRSGLSLVMVGRALELRRLQGMADGLTEPRVVLINGEAGVGKSRLVREFVATLRDHRVLAAHAEPGPLGRPFHLLHDAIESRVGSWTQTPPELADCDEA